MMAVCKKVGALLLTIYFALVYLIPLNGRLLWQPDETRYAEISREMLQRGDWTVPHLLGLRYFEKPVAGYWINNLGQWLFGDTNFAVRFGSVFCTALSAVLVFWLAMKMWRNRSTAMTATLIYLSSLLVFGIGTYSVLDPMVTLWMTAAMACSYACLQAHRVSSKIVSWTLLGFVCAMGFMTKGFLALALPVIALLPVVIREKRLKTLFLWGPLAILSAVLLSLPWVLAIARAEPDFWHYFFWVEHIQRFADSDAQHKAPFWYYLPMLVAGSLPWVGLLPGSLLRGWRERIARPELFFLLCWTLMPLLFFSIAKGKLLTYILPCFAPLALLMAHYAEQLSPQRRLRGLRINGVINVLFGVIGLIALWILSGHLIPKTDIFTSQEQGKIALGVICFGAWAMAGLLSLTNDAQRWRWAAACPVLLALLAGQVIPDKIIDAKQPQRFIQANKSLLSDSRYVLSDNVGVAAGLAWSLKRSDILIYDSKGELEYGLGYQDAQQNFVSEADFPLWLAQARKQGDVSLVLRLSSPQLPENLPVASETRQMNRFLLLQYNQQP
jgi:4-amino-4-deoxy-L-arabinose transferase